MMRNAQSGFTLVEMIVVMVITGIIGGMVAIFLRAPVQGYVDSARRAELSDTADTTLRRITRDIRTALPNSIRLWGSVSGAGSCAGNETCYMEFLPVKSGGRYRRGVVQAGDNPLEFTAADSSFDVIGPMPLMAAGDRLVIYNRGTTGADAYTANTGNDNTGAYASATATTVTISPAKLFPFPSAGSRFQVINTPVSYVCAPATDAAGNGSGGLTRWQGYAIQAAQPTALPASGTPSSALLAGKVSACSFSYGAVGQRLALVTLRLTLTDGGESVTLYNAMHVSNVP